MREDFFSRYCLERFQFFIPYRVLKQVWSTIVHKKTSLVGLVLHVGLRRERDSNPRSLSAQRFSRPPQSTTLPSLLLRMCWSHTLRIKFISTTRLYIAWPIQGAKVLQKIDSCKFFRKKKMFSSKKVYSISKNPNYNRKVETTLSVENTQQFPNNSSMMSRQKEKERVQNRSSELSFVG